MTNEHETPTTVTKPKIETRMVTKADIFRQARALGIGARTPQIIKDYAIQFPYDEKARGFIVPTKLPQDQE